MAWDFVITIAAQIGGEGRMGSAEIFLQIVGKAGFVT